MGSLRTLALPTALAAAVSVFAPSAAHASPHELYLLGGGTLAGSGQRTIAGLGAGVGYRLHLGESFLLNAEGRWLLYAGHAGVAQVGFNFHYQVGTWRPLVGLQFAVLFGDQVRVVTPEAPDAVATWLLAGLVRLEPVRFERNRFTATLLGFDVGLGFDRGSVGYVVGVTLLQVGYRF